MNPVTALIAEDEPVLASALQRQLARLWPDLRITHVASDGLQACAAAPDTLPDSLFPHNHMPRPTGLDLAATRHDQGPLSRIVDLAAQPLHAHVDRIRHGLVRGVPNVFGDRGSTDDLVDVKGQMFE